MEAAGVDRLNIISYGHHMHLRGVGGRMRHFRNGEEIPLWAYDDNYDFNYQDFRRVDPEHHYLLPVSSSFLDNITWGR